MADRELPAGTVTLLFTDIEGSTRLIEELGEDGYVGALAEHRRLLRSVFSAHGGVEVDTQGDAFLCAFADPAAALAAAAQGQDELASGPVKVRMGLHTGELRLTGEGYAGRELHRAARIAATGHGGQVVVSAATRAFIDGDLTDLGEHRLKDFDETVALFQVGSERFPPLKTISNTNLPRPASSLVGRTRERDELLALLRNGSRLVTLSGPGGSGKTRLAVEAAAELVPAFKAGVFWVGLSALRDPALVMQTIAQTLGAKDGLAEHISERELLLLLDNFEQVVESAPELSELLERCPYLKLLVTSRELLRIRGEVDYAVPPLAEPEAVELFCARAQLEPDETIAELCRQLDELPLAIELAAARTTVLSPAQILERFAQRLDLLTGGRDADPRQQTLRATIEWSHDLLNADEQRLFARLAVFRGGCTVAAAEQVAPAELDTLQSLVDKSLLRHTDERFWMLETISAYARERLAASGEEAELRQRHGRFFLDFAEAMERAEDRGADQAELRATIAADHDNLRAALEWARDTHADDVLLRLVSALRYHWAWRALNQERDVWFPLALERAASPVQARMKVLDQSAARARGKGDYARAQLLVEEWRGLAEQEEDDVQILSAMNAAALTATERGDLDDARAQFAANRDRASELGDEGSVAAATVNLCLVASRSGDHDASFDYDMEAVRLFRATGDDGGVAIALANCGWDSLERSDPGGAEGFFREACAIYGRLGAIHHIVWCLPSLAAALVARHEDEPAAQLLGAAASRRQELELGFLDEQDKYWHDQAVARAKAALGEEAFADAWARGEAMTPEEIVAFTMPA